MLRPRGAGEQSRQAAAKLPLGSGMSDCDSSVVKGRDRIEEGTNTFESSQIIPLGPGAMSYIALSWPLVESGHKLIIEESLLSLTG